MRPLHVIILTALGMNIAAGSVVADVLAFNSGSRATDGPDAPNLESLDGGPSMTITRGGVTIHLSAVHGVLNAGPYGIGVGPVDSEAQSTIEGEEAIVLLFAQHTRWETASFDLRDGSLEGPVCMYFLFNHAAGYSDHLVCPADFLTSIPPPEPLQPLVIHPNGFVQIEPREGSAFVLDRISVFAVAGDSGIDASVADLRISLEGIGQFRFGEQSTVRVVVRNEGPDIATGVSAQVALPAGMTVVEARATDGTSFDQASGVWTIGELLGPEHDAQLDLVVHIGPGIGENATFTAQITAVDQINQDLYYPNSASSTREIARPAEEPDSEHPLRSAFVSFLSDACGNGSPEITPMTLLGLMSLRAGLRWKRPPMARPRRRP